MLFSLDNLAKGTDLGTAPTWSAIAFALPAAMLAFTGLETVANLAAETREPGRTLPRSLFVGIGAAVAISFLIAIVAISAYPAHPDPDGPGGYASDLGTVWLHAPLVGLAAAFGGELPAPVVDALRIFVGVTGTLILVAVVTTSFSAAGRLAYSMGRYDMLPRAFGRLSRRTLISPVVDRLHRGALRGRAAHREVRGRACPVPRQPLQLRDPDRLHRGAGRRRSAAVHRAGARAAIPRSRQRADPGDRGAGRSARRRAAHVRDLAHRDRHTRCCPHRRPGLDRLRASSSTTRRASSRTAGCWARDARRGDLVPDIEGAYQRILVP